MGLIFILIGLFYLSISHEVMSPLPSLTNGQSLYQLSSNIFVPAVLALLGLGINIGFISLSILKDIWLLFEINKAIPYGGLDESLAHFSDNVDLFIGIFGMLIYLVMLTFLMIWVYKANQNCWGFAAQGQFKDLKFTSGWSIGWWFIPLANWVQPPRIISEIWKVSTDPQNWKSVPLNPIIPIWWTLWIIAALLARIYMFGSKSVVDIHTLKPYVITGIGVEILDIVVNILVASFVVFITRRQLKLVE